VFRISPSALTNFIPYLYNDLDYYNKFIHQSLTKSLNILAQLRPENPLEALAYLLYQEDINTNP
jgi:hypothetical protein